jgi:hypothetical protein
LVPFLMSPKISGWEFKAGLIMSTVAFPSIQTKLVDPIDQRGKDKKSTGTRSRTEYKLTIKEGLGVVDISSYIRITARKLEDTSLISRRSYTSPRRL